MSYTISMTPFLCLSSGIALHCASKIGRFDNIITVVNIIAANRPDTGG